MLLTIDAGNTRTKWAVFNHAGEAAHQGACLNEALMTADLSPQSLGYERIVISNVAGKQHAALLDKKLAPYRLPVRWINSSTVACNVYNSYSEPSKLGTDRWAALVAAWHIKQAPCVVVNAGTAVTIDAMMQRIDNKQQGEFLGGMILPGLHLMQKSLGLAAAQLPKDNHTQDANKYDAIDLFAKNTIQAIQAGALSAVSGAILRMVHALEQKCTQQPYIIISGGNALSIQHDLTDLVTNRVIIVDNLVLQGLYLLEYATL